MMHTKQKTPLPKGTNRAVLRLYWQQMRNYKVSLIIGALCIPAAALLLDTALPYYLSLAVGTLTQGAEGLEQFLWLAGAVGALGVILNLAGFQALVGHESNVRRDLHNDTVEKLLAKDSDFFANQKIGALTGKLIDFVNGHVGLQDLFIIRTLTFVLATGGGLVIILSHSVLLGLVVLGLLGIIIAQVQISMYSRRDLRYKRKELIGELNGASADTISNNATVKTFAQEAHEVGLVRSISERYRQAYVKDFRLLSAQGSLRLFIMAVVQLVTIGLLASLVKSGQMEVGVAIFTIAYMQRIASNLFALGEMLNGYDKILLQAGPMAEILMSATTVRDAAHAHNLRVRRGDIHFEAVRYAYSDSKDEFVINNLNLMIPAGQKIGIVGHSGAGKTTFTRLLLRFADIDSGKLLIDGQDIATVTQASLRRSIAYVPQEPLLFHRTLRENIAYARPGAPDAHIIAAARKANAYDFIQKLPKGLDTVVGERGIKLSGGQRQRVALARAILKDAPILVLDEATSSLDSVSEKLIQDAMDEVMKGRTSIVIAHRLSTISSLDRIVVLDKGRVAEDGTHTELLERGGIYATLWRHQSGGFIE